MVIIIGKILAGALLFIITLWAFILAFILGVFLPFCIACKFLFRRDLLKVLEEAFKDPFDSN